VLEIQAKQKQQQLNELNRQIEAKKTLLQTIDPELLENSEIN
jgi:hypothetical protein